MTTATLLSPAQTTKSHIPQKMNLCIHVYHVTDYPEIAQQFYKGQRQVLEEFNVAGKISSIKDNWWENPSSYMLVVEDKNTGKIGAGMRLDVIDEVNSIPAERALSYVQPDIQRRLHKYDHVLAEVCAIWVSKEFSERNLPKILMRCAIAVATKLRIRVLLCFANQYTKRMTEEMGFTVVPNVGNNGVFDYPSEEYKTTLMELYLNNSTNTSEEERTLIDWLKGHPKQKIHDVHKDRESYIEYDLRIM